MTLPAESTPVPRPHTPPGSWQSAFDELPREHGFEPLRTEGHVPRELAGTLYRNGPARFAAQGRAYDHWFDGDGAITAVRFSRGGRVEGAVRFVATRGMLEEQRRGRALFAGYGTRSPRGAFARFMTSDRRGLERFIDVKNTANTSVLMDGDHLLALWEGGRPTAIDPDTLDTIGETDLGGVLTTFSAHPHDVAARHATYNIGLRYGLRTELDVFERPREGRFRKIGQLTLPGPTMVHDFGVTTRHLFVYAAPLRLGLLRTALNLGSASGNLRWRPELGGELLVAPLDDLRAVRRIATDPRFVWHFANAYSTRRSIVADVVAYEDFASNELFATLRSASPRGEVRGHATRLSLDLATGIATWEVLSSTIGDYPTIAPRVAGSRHRFVYMAAFGSNAVRGAMLHDRIVKLDVETGREESLALGAGLYPGEPIFVPRHSGEANEAEDDGWLLVLVYDAGRHTSRIAIVDARRLSDGPVGAASFDHHVPPSVHGRWAPAREG